MIYSVIGWMMVAKRRMFSSISIYYSRSKLTMVAQKRDDPTDQIFVFFTDEAKAVGVKTIRG